MGKQGSSSKKGSCLIKCLIILAVIIMFSFIIAFGWIAGVIWLIFFRKRMNADSKKQKKYTIGVSIASALSLLFFVYAIVTAPPSPTSLVLSSPMNGQNLEINSDYTIDVQYEPENASLSAVKYEINNPSLASITTDPDNPSFLTLHTNGEGSITVTAQKGDIESNVLSFDIIDSARIEQEAAAEAERLRITEEKKTTDEIVTADIDERESVDADDKLEEPLGFNVMFSKTFRNDATGNWRLARIAEDINIEEYAVDYYNNYFESDDEIHIIINFTLNTTTRIAVMGNLLDVSIMEYVDGEEHDAKIACSGTLLNEYHVNIDNGRIEEINADSSEVTSLDARETESEKQTDSTPIDSAAQPVNENNSQVGETLAGKSSPVPESDAVQTNTDSIQSADSTSSKNGSGSDGSNFNTYDNQSQQQTSDTYVLNTSTHKIHYPHCSSVPKIAPQNYATSNSSVDELKSQGYTTCGKCF